MVAAGTDASLKDMAYFTIKNSWVSRFFTYKIDRQIRQRGRGEELVHVCVSLFVLPPQLSLLLLVSQSDTWGEGGFVRIKQGTDNLNTYTIYCFD